MPTLTTTGKRKLKINKLTKTQMNAVATPSSTELYLVDPQFVGNKLLVSDLSGNIAETNQTIPTVDQTYNASSANAQSGVAVASAISGKQDTLVSGTNIKTINNTSLLGSGDITISGSEPVYNSQTNTLEF